ncbi:MAG: tetratricopeptide repeat protein [Gemmatimonadales bacterium]|nr:tetratricopeptide repeat protein [Gemmatimonadales bacterium]
MTLDKLKVTARQHEQREDWDAAIELYRQAIRTADSGNEGGDPTLHNRVGDLEHKAGRASAACEAWHAAALRYAEQGFFSNAIALCGKILRLDPDRIATYLDLARFQARKRVLYDVRQNLTIYRDQMMARGEGDKALGALERFGAEFPAWQELKGLLNELLGHEADADADRISHHESAGDEKLIFLDTTTSPAPDSAGWARQEDHGDDQEMVIETTAIVDFDPDAALSSGAISGLEATSFEGDGDATGAEVEEPSGVVEFERTAAADHTVQLGGLESIEFTPPAVDPGEAIAGLESSEFEPPPPDEEPSPDPAVVPVIEVPDPLGDRVVGQGLLEHGDRVGGIAALERALAAHLEEEDWVAAFRVAGELIDAEPRSIARHQTRVEVAAKWGESGPLCEAYQALGDAFVRLGSADKGVAVYRRILELDEHHVGAREALRRMAPPSREEATPEGFIDFGAMVNDDVGPRSTRMRTETTNISADENETFREALAEFKRALDQNLPIEDHQTHYDLGLAFREMGLLDEAIGEFQKALRSPEGRLRTAEALGQTFFEQGRPAVAEAVLRSVEQGGTEGDAEKIGVLYWLGRALEAQGRGTAARGCYERVLAVDVGFHDVMDRVTALANDEVRE